MLVLISREQILVITLLLPSDTHIGVLFQACDMPDHR